MLPGAVPENDVTVVTTAVPPGRVTRSRPAAGRADMADRWVAGRDEVVEPLSAAAEVSDGCAEAVPAPPASAQPIPRAAATAPSPPR